MSNLKTKVEKNIFLSSSKGTTSKDKISSKYELSCSKEKNYYSKAAFKDTSLSSLGLNNSSIRNSNFMSHTKSSRGKLNFK